MIAIWASVLRKKYGKNIKKNADDYLEKVNTTGEELFYDFCIDCNDFKNVFINEVNELITRHKMLKDYGIVSFGKEFDDLPAMWIDALEIIDSTIIKALEAKAKKK